MMRILSALFFPIAIAGLLAWLAPRDMDTRLHLQRLEVESAAELETAFEEMGYSWPPSEVPAIELQTFPADLADVSDARQRKALFFRALLPIVLAENRVIERLREQLIALFDKGVGRLNRSELSWLTRVAEQYQVEGNLASRQLQQELLGRIDVVPPELVLIQAANESGWGTSRFALSGNNLFGQYTYQQSDGIVPLNRRAGETHALRAFTSIDGSVRSYIHNLNTHQAYSELRNLRQQLRSRGQEPSGDDLAAGLGAYSERGAAYVEEIRAMIRSNQLPALLKDVSLDREGS